MSSLGQPKSISSNFLHFLKLIKRLQTQFHAHTMRNTKLLGQKSKLI